MQFKTIALATAFALTSSLAFAQAGGGNAAGGAAVSGSGGATMNSGGGAANSTVDTHGRNEPGTNGMAKSGPGREPGARDKSRPGGEGVNDRPGG
jgi:hypothetical protein